MQMILPFPLKMLRLLLFLIFVIYLPVAIFKSDLFLVFLDLTVIFGVLVTVRSKNWKISLSKNSGIYALFLFYLISVFVAFSLQSDIADPSAIKKLRNLIFGVGVFIISSTYIIDRVRLHALLRTILWGALLAGLYGYRQIFFGFWDFELDRLALMGSSLQELELLERFRVTSSFGDPLLCAFVMMIAIFVYFASRYMNLMPVITRVSHPLGLIIILSILVSSLTRAPLLGLVCGMAVVAVFSFQLTPKGLLRGVLFPLLVVLGISTVTVIVESGLLADSNNYLIKMSNSALSSVWSLTQLFISAETSSNFFLVEQSRGQRLEAWGKGVAYLVAHPFGAGLSDVTMFDFSTGDTGILKIALLVGVPGAFAMLAILVLVFIKGMSQVIFSVATQEKKIAVQFLGLWVAILVTNGISSLLDGSVASILIWTAAGITINLKRIFAINKKEASSSVPT